MWLLDQVLMEERHRALVENGEEVIWPADAVSRSSAVTWINFALFLLAGFLDEGSEALLLMIISIREDEKDRLLLNE